MFFLLTTPLMGDPLYSRELCRPDPDVFFVSVNYADLTPMFFLSIKEIVVYLRIPLNSATRSTEKRPLVPQEFGLAFHSKTATQATCRSEATGIN